MNLKFLMFSLLVFAYLAFPVNAQNVEYYGIETHLNREAATHTIILSFDRQVSKFDYRTKYRPYNLKVESKYGTVRWETKGEGRDTVISFYPVNTQGINKTQIQLTFETKENIAKNGEIYTFSSVYIVDVPVERAFAIVYLPETATLKTNVSNESFSPRYGRVLSDGKHIMVYWERENIKGGDDLEFSITYIMPLAAGSLYDVAIIVILAVILVVVIAVGYVRRLHRQSSVKVVMPLLKGDERVIVDILRERKGEAIQKVLVRESDFSKAKVSRLVANLKERGIVDVEHLGRTNRVKLKLNA